MSQTNDVFHSFSSAGIKSGTANQFVSLALPLEEAGSVLTSCLKVSTYVRIYRREKKIV
jgi:hypothetical protein